MSVEESSFPTQSSIQEHESPIKEKKEKKRRTGRHGARNERRHKNLTKWLLDTFRLESGDTVLDVAGGRGELAARLTMCHSMKVVMVDPRPANVLECYETVVLKKLPNKWQQRIEQRQRENPGFLRETLESRFRQLVMCLDERTMEESEELKQAIEESTLLVGMHADGATEAIIDVALHYKKPFVVVPCCVFPRLFPQRMILNEEGQPVQVRQHDQFCQYLVNKHPNFRMETLPFEGRNIGIWWDGR